MKINLDDDISKRLQEHLDESSFNKLEELLRFIVEDYLDANEGQDTSDKKGDDINDRLKDLGYF